MNLAFVILGAIAALAGLAVLIAGFAIGYDAAEPLESAQ